MTTVVIEKQRSLNSVAIMQTVLLALIPSIVIYAFLLGVGVLLQLTLASLVCVACEYLANRLRHRPCKTLDIYSGLISAWIIALSIPATSPFWLVMVGVVVAILLAKHCYGGVGVNIFNPAMVGFCVLYVSYPEQMSQWPIEYQTIADSWQAIFQATPSIDSQAGATTLTALKVTMNTQANALPLFSWQSYQTIALSYLIGGSYLLYKRIIDWRLPVFMLLGIVITHLFLQLLSGNQPGLLLQLSSGAILFALFFIVTDPTTAATSRHAKILFAFCIGMAVILLRKFNIMADSVAFVILLANLAVPLLDEYNIKKYGGSGNGK